MILGRLFYNYIIMENQGAQREGQDDLTQVTEVARDLSKHIKEEVKQVPSILEQSTEASAEVPPK